MSFYKKVLVLKQVSSEFSQSFKPISGIARIEIENGVFELHLSLINFLSADLGEFYAYLVDGNKRLLEFKLGNRPSAFHTVLDNPPDLSNGFAVGVCLISCSIPTTALFACVDGFNFSLADFKKAVADKCIESRKNIKRSEDSSIKPQKTICEKEQVATVSAPEDFVSNKDDSVYNDEAVATENYFDIEDNLSDKLLKIKEKTNGWLRLENELPYGGRKEEKQQSQADYDRPENATNTFSCQNHNPKEIYFDTVRKDLAELFDKHPEEERLSKTFPNGRFVKINYSPQKYYVVGVISENKKEKYLCYGVPAVYSPEPPKQLKGFCQFIPLSIFDLTGDGYWMMFQDAENGECIKLR